MKIIKQALRKTLAAFGYEILPAGVPKVRFENFANLALAYEHSISRSGVILLPNEIRPKLLARLLGTPPSEAYFILQALAKCKDLPGDVCEFGVAQGETSALIANEIASQGSKRLHLFDSFEGLPQPTDKDKLIDDIFSLGSIEAYAGTMSCPEDMVKSRMKAIGFPESRFVIHKGFIEMLIDSGAELPKDVSFAYVDFDFYEPILIALNYLHEVTPKGAIIIVDDYDFFSTGSKSAVDEFMASKNIIGKNYECFIPDKTLGYFVVLQKTS